MNLPPLGNRETCKPGKGGKPGKPVQAGTVNAQAIGPEPASTLGFPPFPPFPTSPGIQVYRGGTLPRWTLTLMGLRGEPWPKPADLPGVVHACRDELDQITDPKELALCAGISKPAAHMRLQQRAAAAQEGTEP
jgi:hypothetical protein